MQMIDVLKRLAELDADNPRVEKVAMTNEQSLATVSNIEGETITESINECGPMGMMGGMNTPASFSINASAGSGDEVASMLTQIMNLAGVKSVGGMGDLDHDGDHDMGDHEIELGAPHAVEIEPKSAGGEMGDLIGMIDRMNGPEDEEVGPESLGPEEGESPVADMADEVRGMADEMAGMKDEGIGAGFDTATTTPDEKVKAHDHGDSQVTIGKKPEPEKKAGGGNPYVETVAAQLLRDYKAFVAEAKKKSNKKVVEEPNEGNEFSGELTNARKNHAKEFKVDGKTFPVKEGAKPTKFDKSQYDGDREEPYDSKSKPTPKGELGKAFRKKMGMPEKKTNEEQKTMSRAAKGMMKYGKDGMKALAKAGKEGKDLDKVRDKYNKYD